MAGRCQAAAALPSLRSFLGMYRSRFTCTASMHSHLSHLEQLGDQIATSLHTRACAAAFAVVPRRAVCAAAGALAAAAAGCAAAAEHCLAASRWLRRPPCRRRQHPLRSSLSLLERQPCVSQLVLTPVLQDAKHRLSAVMTTAGLASPATSMSSCRSRGWSREVPPRSTSLESLGGSSNTRHRGPAKPQLNLVLLMLLLLPPQDTGRQQLRLLPPRPPPLFVRTRRRQLPAVAAAAVAAVTVIAAPPG